jgi:integrase
MRGHIRKRGKSWAVVVYLGSENGRERYKWYSHKNRRDAEAHLAQLLVQVQAGGVAPPGRLRTGDFLEQWLREDISGRLAPTTQEIYGAAIRRHLTPVLGQIPLSRLTPPAIQRCLNAMLGRGLAPATVHQVHRTLNTALNTAARWGLLARNPCEAVSAPVVSERPATVWDEEQVRLFLAEAKRSSVHYTLYLTMLLTGMRPGEALALKWDAVNLMLGGVTVKEKFYRLGRKEIWGATKTHRVYPLAIPQFLTDALRLLREDQRRQKASLGEGYEDHGLVFAQANGRPLHERNIYRRDFQRIIRRAKLPRIRLYDLRHCHATHLAEMGTPMHITQRRLGHRNPGTALRYYVHVLPGSDRQAAERLAARFINTGLTAEA